MSSRFSRRTLGVSVIALLVVAAAALALFERWAPAAAITIVLVGLTSILSLITQSSVRALSRQAGRSQQRLEQLRSRQNTVRDAVRSGLATTREETRLLQTRLDATAARLELAERRLTGGFETLRLAIEDGDAQLDERTMIHGAQPPRRRSDSE